MEPRSTARSIFGGGGGAGCQGIPMSNVDYDLPQLQPAENVRMRTSPGWVPAKVTQKCEEPRSYLVQKGVKIYRRNHQSSDIDPQRQEPIVPSRIPTKVPVISTPDPVIKTVSTPALPVPSQEGGESKACKHDTVPVNKPGLVLKNLL